MINVLVIQAEVRAMPMKVAAIPLTDWETVVLRQDFTEEQKTIGMSTNASTVPALADIAVRQYALQMYLKRVREDVYAEGHFGSRWLPEVRNLTARIEKRAMTVMEIIGRLSRSDESAHYSVKEILNLFVDNQYRIRVSREDIPKGQFAWYHGLVKETTDTVFRFRYIQEGEVGVTRSKEFTITLL